MLVWGSVEETRDLGVTETRRCDTCEKERPFKLFLRYRYSHIWYVFTWVSRKAYLLLCDVCRRGHELDSKKVEAALTKSPIPFQRRYGWTFLVALIAAAIAWGAYAERAREANDATYISDPRPNDLYVVEVSKLLEEPERSPMYGVLRVKAVSGDRVELLVPKVGYSKVAGATRDIDTGKSWGNDYYAAETMVVGVSDIKGMRDSHTIRSVRRP